MVSNFWGRKDIGIFPITTYFKEMYFCTTNCKSTLYGCCFLFLLLLEMGSSHSREHSCKLNYAYHGEAPQGEVAEGNSEQNPYTMRIEMKQ